MTTISLDTDKTELIGLVRAAPLEFAVQFTNYR